MLTTIIGALLPTVVILILGFFSGWHKTSLAIRRPYSQAGMTHANDHTVDETQTGPFGGEKNSGLGRFGGEWILHEFTRDHWITARNEQAVYPF